MNTLISRLAAASLLALSACATSEPGPGAGSAPEAAAAPALPLKTEPPSQLYPGLFQAVAEAGLFPTKDWVDAEPKTAPGKIMSAWYDAGPQTPQEIGAFVNRWFDLPDEIAATPPEGDGLTMREHIDALWPELTRNAVMADRHSSLISLPEPYIVPGGRFREVYYWDAYFTMTGMGDEHDAIKRAMVDNFAAMIDRYGFVPNANRTYYLSRSQPPFFFEMVGLLNEADPAYEWAEYLPQLKAEHGFWMKGSETLKPGNASLRVVRLADGTLLNRYWDNLAIPRDESYNDDVETAATDSRPEPVTWRNLRAGAESGWDFSSRWFEDGSLSSIETTFIVPPDLNSLLYGLEMAIAAGCARAGDDDCEAEYRAMAGARQTAIQTYLWNDESGLYDDYDFVEKSLKGNVSAAALYPLFFRVATEDQAARSAEAVAEQLLADGGLLTTTQATGQQWDAPNGWAPLHWIAVNGFADYGATDLSRAIAERWLQTVSRTYCQTGKMVEKYDVTEPRPGGGGEYPTQDGFGWTNGVTIALMDMYQEFMPYGEITQAAPGDAGRCLTTPAAAP